MPPDPHSRPARASFETRLDELREEARAKGTVSGNGVHAAGSPMPDGPMTPEKLQAASRGYYGLPLLKPPVWEWMIAAYFFIGGLAGMAALIASAALLHRDWALVRVMTWTAAIGAVLSPILLTWDLGRPLRFINMLRVFKFQSPMSVGSWIVSSFGAAALPAVVLLEWYLHRSAAGAPSPLLFGFAVAAVIGAGATGIFLATYTGALIGATAVPAWNLHHVLLPFHFGMAGLGSAVAVAELAGLRSPALNAIGWFTAGAETLVMLTLEVRKHGRADHALHHGRSGWTLRAGELLEGPLALLFRAVGAVPLAALSFLIGALVTRFGWLWAGSASACDPAAVLTQQSAPHGSSRTESA